MARNRALKTRKCVVCHRPTFTENRLNQPVCANAPFCGKDAK